MSYFILPFSYDITTMCFTVHLSITHVIMQQKKKEEAYQRIGGNALVSALGITNQSSRYKSGGSDRYANDG